MKSMNKKVLAAVIGVITVSGIILVAIDILSGLNLTLIQYEPQYFPSAHNNMRMTNQHIVSVCDQ